MTSANNPGVSGVVCGSNMNNLVQTIRQRNKGEERMDDKATGEQCAASLPDVAKASLQELVDSPALRASVEEIATFLRTGPQEINRRSIS